jgi:Putative mono-oxygenase ydhR
MSKKILQVNFKFNVSKDALGKAMFSMAGKIADVPGCQWKIWLMNEAESEAGGIYLFDGEESLKAYLEGPIIAAMKSHPALSGFSIKRFDAVDALTQITRGPID